MKPAALPLYRAVAVATLLAWLAPRSARAEGSISYKYQDYHELGGRIKIETHGAYIEQDLGAATKLKAEGIIDAIAGATPNGQPAPAGSDQVPLATMTDRRKAWNGGVSHQFPRLNLALGAANSRESDYVSAGASLNAAADFNQKNTTLLAGLAGTRDRIKVFHQRPWERKRTRDAMIGLTQLLDPNSAITANLTWGRQAGHLSDPYKLVQRNTEIIPGVSLPLTFPENRPGGRDKWIGRIAYQRAFPEARGAFEGSYRYYHDNFGIDAHTLDAAWFQRLGPAVILRPGVRFYDQTAADFYVYRLDDTPLVPVAGRPRREGPFYSSDYRLSAMRTFTYGVKLVWRATDALQVDAAFERYDMRGTDGVTPQSAYARANIVTAGLKLAW
jgi:hypothetical protein